MKSLKNKSVLKQEKQQIEESKKGRNISEKIPFEKGSNYIGLVSSDFETGYFHYIEADNGEAMYGPCLDQTTGWSPDECPLCKIALSHFKKARGLKKRNPKLADAEKDVGKQFKASFHAFFYARKGMLVQKEDGGEAISFVIKKKVDKKIKKTAAPVQKLSLTQPQYEKLIDLVDSLDEDQTEDVLKYVIDFYKDEDQGIYGEVTPDLTEMKNSLKNVTIPDDLKTEVENYFKIEDYEEKKKEYKKFADSYLKGDFDKPEYEEDDEEVEEEIEDISEDEIIEEDEEEEIEELPKKPTKSKTKKSKTKGVNKIVVAEEDDETEEIDELEDVM